MEWARQGNGWRRATNDLRSINLSTRNPGAEKAAEERSERLHTTLSPVQS